MDQNYESTSQTAPIHSTGTTVKLIAAWLIVGLPAAWGVAQTVQKSLPLFTSPAAAVSPATAPANANSPATLPAK